MANPTYLGKNRGIIHAHLHGHHEARKGDSTRGETPLAGAWGCPPYLSNIPLRMGERRVE